MKRSWGKSMLKYCPKTRKVWEERYDTNNKCNKIVVHPGMPSFGLERKEIPPSTKLP